MNYQYIPAVVQAVAGKDYLIYCYFDDGKITCMDMKPLIGKGIFAQIEDPAVFAGTLTVMHETAAWDISGRRDPANCIDLDPITLYEQPAVSDPLGGASIA